MEKFDIYKEIISELINTGIGKAASILNQMLNEEIEINLPTVRILDHEQFMEWEQNLNYKEGFVVVNQDFGGEFSGQGMVYFPLTNGKTLINTLMDLSDDTFDGSFSAIDLDAIGEVGNTIINSVQGTISDMVMVESKLGLPTVTVKDELVSMIDHGQMCLVGETIFRAKSACIEGVVLLVYSYENMELILRNVEFGDDF